MTTCEGVLSMATVNTSSTINLAPLTRIEGHLDIEVVVEDGQVVEAFSAGTMFRGFEKILRGREPLDATHYTQRICGVCPIAHGMASSKTLEAAFGIQPLANGRILRNLILGANFLQSHILHFYHLALLDYVDTTGHPVLDKSPWQPAFSSPDMLRGSDAVDLLGHYVDALAIRRKCHQMGAIFGGKMPCSPVFVPSGCTETVTTAKIDAFRALLFDITEFIDGVYLPDVALLADPSGPFGKYLQIGGGCGNLLAYGVFDIGGRTYLPGGTYSAGDNQTRSFDPGRIAEDLTHSYYDESTGEPAVGKVDAYSWIKAPRYGGEVYEVGPLARMKIAGLHPGGISVMDRLQARARERFEIALTMTQWLGELASGEPGHSWTASPSNGTGMGLTEAPRGALGHWIDIADSKISGYQIVTPTAWNASPKDELGQPGPIEQALVGTPVADPDNPIEPLRVVHSFDPCLACSVHLLRPKQHVRAHVVGSGEGSVS
jgi:hydrogenase large subunit